MFICCFVLHLFCFPVSNSSSFLSVVPRIFCFVLLYIFPLVALSYHFLINISPGPPFNNPRPQPNPQKKKKKNGGRERSFKKPIKPMRVIFIMYLTGASSPSRRTRFHAAVRLTAFHMTSFPKVAVRTSATAPWALPPSDYATCFPIQRPQTNIPDEYDKKYALALRSPCNGAIVTRET